MPSHWLKQWLKSFLTCPYIYIYINLSCNRELISAEFAGWGWCNIGIATKWYLGPLLLTWFNFNPSMHKYLHPVLRVGWSYLSIPKLQRCNRWSLGMDKWLHPTHYNGCNYLSMLGFKLNHISKIGHSSCHQYMRISLYAVNHTLRQSTTVII